LITCITFEIRFHAAAISAIAAIILRFIVLYVRLPPLLYREEHTSALLLMPPYLPSL